MPLGSNGKPHEDPANIFIGWREMAKVALIKLQAVSETTIRRELESLCGGTQRSKEEGKRLHSYRSSYFIESLSSICKERKEGEKTNFLIGVIMN